MIRKRIGIPPVVDNKGILTGEERETILRAVTKMTRHDMIDLSAVDSQGKLAGLPSHVYVGKAFWQKWMGVKGSS